MRKTAFFLPIFALLHTIPSPAAGPDPEFAQYFSYQCDSQKIEDRQNPKSSDMRRLLRAAAVKTNQHLTLTSCYRSQDHQNALLASRHCQPYGPLNCSQSTARYSQHSYGIAADFVTNLKDDKLFCRALDSARQEVTGGAGGVGGYGQGVGHLDVRPYHQNWNVCCKVLGNCRDDTGAYTYASTIVDQFERSQFLESYKLSKNDSTNVDNVTDVENFFFLRFFANSLETFTTFLKNVVTFGGSK
jgi:D-alanyl-D-alanine carboxypeptidase